jgi:glycosyltransferase involved in cell wall biosynthesis
MLEGFKLYTALSENPFELRIAGVGELVTQASSFEGVNLLGYVPNSKLPGIIQDSRALLLFSEIEAWGVVIAESVANYRPVICSDACGAAVDLVEHGKNGWILENPTPQEIANKLLEFERFSLSELEHMSRANSEFANLYGPNTWIDFLKQISASRKS